MKKSYGIPYVGNKQKIAKEILEQLPPGNRLVDLFGGGGSITHYAMVNYPHKWKEFMYNDINPLITTLFKESITGKYDLSTFKPQWVSRDEFFKKKDEDGYIKYIWSHGNDGESYLYGEDIEEFKRNAHNFIVFGDSESLKYLENHYSNSYHWFIKQIYTGNLPHDRLNWRKLAIKLEAIRVCVDYGDRQVYDEYKDYTFQQFMKLPQVELCRTIDNYIPTIPKKNWNRSGLDSLKNFERMESLQHLERLEQLHNLKQQKKHNQTTLTPVDTPKLTITNKDYHKYQYQQGDIVYCDIPYQNTLHDYGGFNHEKFYKWAYSQPYPIYISEYTPGEVIWTRQRRAMKNKYSHETLQKIN